MEMPFARRIYSAVWETRVKTRATTERARFLLIKNGIHEMSRRAKEEHRKGFFTLGKILVF